jgi:exopolysaccharide biosynthesis predicted pyruvyltransferase EpsI
MFFIVITFAGWIVVPFVRKRISLLVTVPLQQADEDPTTPISVSSLQRQHNLPKPIPIDHARNPRYACLRSIREEHERLLRPKIIQSSSVYNYNHIRVVLMDPAYHENVGDHMITVAEQTFLHKYYSPQPPTTSRSNVTTHEEEDWYEECGYVQAGIYAPSCEQRIIPLMGYANDGPMKNNDKKRSYYNHQYWIWHGGGNWGDLWRTVQMARLNSLETWIRQSTQTEQPPQQQSSTSIFMTMPNSWYYRSLEFQTADVTRIRNLLLLPPQQNNDTNAWKHRVIFTWREQSSYDIAQKLLGDVLTNLLVPDIAFQLGPYDSVFFQQQQPRPVVDILVLLRHDHESVYAEYRNRQTFRALLESIPGAEAMTFSIVDWKDRYDRFHDDYKFFSETAIQLLAQGTIVICDRLHAAILAYLSDLSFIYLDQESGKIHKTLSVAFRLCETSVIDERMSRAHNMSDAVTQAVQRLQLLRNRPSFTGKDRKQKRQALRQRQQQLLQKQPSR